MAIASGAGFQLNPRSPAQTRALIAALKAADDTTAAAIAALEADVLVLQGQADPVSAVFDATIAVGQPVYVVSDGHADIARATSATLSNVAGLVYTAATSGNTGAYVPEGGRVTQADWTAVIGAASLTPGAEYYLSATLGLLTTTPPSTATQIVVKVGRALTTQTFVVERGLRILL